MGTKGRIRLSDVFDMLKKCAPGHEVFEGPHHYRIKWQGRTYTSLPTGQHGKRDGRAEIEKGHVKHLARFLGIEACAKDLLEILR